MEATAFEARDVKEPDTEAVVRGAREGFTERLQTNITLVRRRLRTPDLVVEHLTLGRRSRTDVALLYLHGVAKQAMVDELRKRLQAIDIDGVMESGYIEQLIEDAPFSIFPTVGNTERPDVVAGKLLEGRIAILTDNTPFALTVPYLFIENLQVSEDYYSRPYAVTLVRWVRMSALVITIGLPALYVAANAFHPELVPTPLVITVAAGREGVPMPSMLEVILMGFIFELLREAGVRLPRPVGQAVSIVGALVIGEGAVAAGLVSNDAVIVAALTGIAGFAVPAMNDAYMFLRIMFVLIAGQYGLIGVAVFFVMIVFHLCRLRSLGVPYLAPLAPTFAADLKDVLVRAPHWLMTNRPLALESRGKRQSVGLPPATREQKIFASKKGN